MNRAVQWVKDAWRNKSLTHGLRSPDWPRARLEWLQDNPACAACGGVDETQVHHKKPFHLYPELELERSNFITLCEAKWRGNHHLQIGHLGSWRNVNPRVVQDAEAKFQGRALSSSR